MMREDCAGGQLSPGLEFSGVVTMRRDDRWKGKGHHTDNSKLTEDELITAARPLDK